MAMVSKGMRGYKEAAADNSTLSAHIPAGKDAFSWLVPVIIPAFCNTAAAPTKNREYGA